MFFEIKDRKKKNKKNSTEELDLIDAGDFIYSPSFPHMSDVPDISYFNVVCICSTIKEKSCYWDKRLHTQWVAADAKRESRNWITYIHRGDGSSQSMMFSVC